jgi:ABC-type dipeptide/oligopeptide/nickel transport system permease subunit
MSAGIDSESVAMKPPKAQRASMQPPSFLSRLTVLGTAGTLGAILLIVAVGAVLLGPILWTVDPTNQDIGHALLGVSAQHPLGTDHLGRDLLARTLHGGLTSLQIGFVSVLLGVAVGLLIGVAGAVLGGWIEAILMRLVDALLAIPGIVQALILVAVLGRGVGPLIVALGIYSMPIFARIAHQTAKQILQLDYIAAADALGSSRLRTVFIHILPNLSSPIVTIASFRVGANLLTGAALNFFGLGAQAPAMEWGLMVAEGQPYSWQSPLVIIAPGLALVITAMGLNLLGDGLRQYLDPKRGS